MWVVCFQNTGGIILHNIPTTTSSCYHVGVRAQCLTQISARICAGKHVHELTCTCWGPGVWTPAEPRETQSHHKRWRTHAVNGISVCTIHKHRGQLLYLLRLPGRRERWWHMDTTLSLPLPSASVTLAYSRMPLSTQTHAHVHSRTLLIFMLSFCRTHLSSDTGGLNPGPVCYWFSERTCSCSGGRRPHLQLVCLFLSLSDNLHSSYAVMNSTELRHMFPVKSSRRNFPHAEKRWKETISHVPLLTCTEFTFECSTRQCLSSPHSCVWSAQVFFFNSCTCREIFSLTQNYSKVSPKSARQASFFFFSTALGRH